MSKNNFLLIDLNEEPIKKLGETITNDTSRKILNHLTDKDDTEQNIAQMLTMPISTVHYHLQKLQEAGLVKVEEFHYSPKGREVNHYKLANKYIIIAPKKISGLKEKLKSILPVVFGLVGLGAILSVFTALFTRSSFTMSAQKAMVDNMPLAVESAPLLGSQLDSALQSSTLNAGVMCNQVSVFPWAEVLIAAAVGAGVVGLVWLIVALIKSKPKHS